MAYVRTCSICFHHSVTDVIAANTYDRPKSRKDHMYSVLSSSHTFNIKPPLSLERQGQDCMKSTESRSLTRITSTRGCRPGLRPVQSHLNSSPVTKDTGQISLSCSVDGVSVLVFLCSSLYWAGH
ncbi:unnamed protein product [Leuciscus chuanchicus]